MAAIAGRVAIVPSGEYEHGRQYKRLDSVRYLGGVYMAKKDNVDEYPAYNDDNEYWMFMVGATDIADYEHPGIVMPDGKTITIDEDGTITGASTGFVGSTEEFEIAKEAGELVDGQLVFLDDDYTEGGGSGSDEVYIGTEEPTGDDKPEIWIDPEEDPNPVSADEVSYDGAKSGLSAKNVQNALDEIGKNLEFAGALKALSFTNKRYIQCSVSSNSIYYGVIAVVCLNKVKVFRLYSGTFDVLFQSENKESRDVNATISGLTLTIDLGSQYEHGFAVFAGSIGQYGYDFKITTEI